MEQTKTGHNCTFWPMPTITPACRGLPTKLGNTARGASSPAKPALTMPEPLSHTRAETSPSSAIFYFPERWTTNILLSGPEPGASLARYHYILASKLHAKWVVSDLLKYIRRQQTKAIPPADNQRARRKEHGDCARRSMCPGCQKV